MPILQITVRVWGTNFPSAFSSPLRQEESGSFGFVNLCPDAVLFLPPYLKDLSSRTASFFLAGFPSEYWEFFIQPRQLLVAEIPPPLLAKISQLTTLLLLLCFFPKLGKACCSLFLFSAVNFSPGARWNSGFQYTEFPPPRLGLLGPLAQFFFSPSILFQAVLVESRVVVLFRKEVTSTGHHSNATIKDRLFPLGSLGRLSCLSRHLTAHCLPPLTSCPFCYLHIDFPFSHGAAQTMHSPLLFFFFFLLMEVAGPIFFLSPRPSDPPFFSSGRFFSSFSSRYFFSPLPTLRPGTSSLFLHACDAMRSSLLSSAGTVPLP